jgi:hypothetical protein
MPADSVLKLRDVDGTVEEPALSPSAGHATRTGAGRNGMEPAAPSTDALPARPAARARELDALLRAVSSEATLPARDGRDGSIERRDARSLRLD